MNYEKVSLLLFVVSVCILAFGPYALTVADYGVTFSFAVITLQQFYDIEESGPVTSPTGTDDDNNETSVSRPSNDTSEDNESNESDVSTDNAEVNDEASPECDVCNENRIYNIFKNLRDRLTFSDNV